MNPESSSPPWRGRSPQVQPMATNEQLNPNLEKGCKCENVCKGGYDKQTDCLCFVARQRGPIKLGPCKCTPGGQTYHDRTDLCLRCEGSGVGT